jgi:Ca-activated chloride channel family protein
MRVRLDEETLKNISVLTHGEYFYAGTAEDLKKVYEGLSSRMVVERKETEISALFAGLGALLAVLAAGLSVWWFGRVDSRRSCRVCGQWCRSGRHATALRLARG